MCIERRLGIVTYNRYLIVLVIAWKVEFSKPIETIGGRFLYSMAGEMIMFIYTNNKYLPRCDLICDQRLSSVARGQRVQLVLVNTQFALIISIIIRQFKIKFAEFTQSLSPEQ